MSDFLKSKVTFLGQLVAELGIQPYLENMEANKNSELTRLFISWIHPTVWQFSCLSLRENDWWMLGFSIFNSPEPKAPRKLIGWQLPSSVVVHTFKLEYLCSLQADLNQILSVAFLWWGIACICI